MNISPVQSNVKFKGYDAIRLKGLYMQGLTTPAEKNIFNEVKEIAGKERLDLFINQCSRKLSRSVSDNFKRDENLSVWGQDRKAFVYKSGIPTILWHSSEKRLDKKHFSSLDNYSVEISGSFPRGGNYYIGYKDNGDKWMLMNSISVYDDKSYKVFGDLPSAEMIPDMFDIEEKNIFYIREFTRDLDESIRPIGYPYVLVNDFKETSKNIEKLEKAFPNSHEIINRLKKYAKTYRDDYTDNKIAALKNYGFIPIKIGADYNEGINFINAIAFKNENDKISYITNSTKGSHPELEYLEQLFEEDMRSKVPNLENIYFVSGGEKDKTQKNAGYDDSCIELPPFGFARENAIMGILADRHGGIHCMTAEIPDFECLNC